MPLLPNSLVQAAQEAAAISHLNLLSARLYFQEPMFPRSHWQEQLSNPTSALTLQQLRKEAQPHPPCSTLARAWPKCPQAEPGGPQVRCQVDASKQGIEARIFTTMKRRGHPYSEAGNQDSSSCMLPGQGITCHGPAGQGAWTRREFCGGRAEWHHPVTALSEGQAGWGWDLARSPAHKELFSQNSSGGPDSAHQSPA